jgi:hypothetical protein
VNAQGSGGYSHCDYAQSTGWPTTPTAEGPARSRSCTARAHSTSTSATTPPPWRACAATT